MLLHNQSIKFIAQKSSIRARAIDLPFKLFLLKIVPLVNCPCTARARARNLDRRNSNKTPERVRTTKERAMPLQRRGIERRGGANFSNQCVVGCALDGRRSHSCLSVLSSLDAKSDLLLSQMNLYSYGSLVEFRPRVVSLSTNDLARTCFHDDSQSCRRSPWPFFAHDMLQWPARIN